MIVYADRKRRISSRLAPGEWRNTLVRLGEIEAAVSDMLSPDIDARHPTLDQLRAISIRVAGRDLSAIADMPAVPDELCASVPEGYAYYAVYPEDYAKAARRFYRDVQPREAVVIGIRSIGTSLSAIVAATLRQSGCSVSSFTVRPRGHPFDRRVRWQGYDIPTDAWHLIVDEGPGLSGSSFAAVARRLGELEVPDSRIVLFPSWDADGSSFCSEVAKLQWIRHRRYVQTRDRFPECRDLSAGKWRELFDLAPAVQPQHERRKYLCGAHLFKFEGLGDFGQEKFDRARALSQAGFTNRPCSLQDGYLESEFLAGAPVQTADASLAEWTRNYLRFLASEFRSDIPVPYTDILRMIETNVTEGLGPEWASRLDSLAKFRSAVIDAGTVRIDGRILPYEFLRTAAGFIKVDALDHYDDHFFPGCQDIAWDVAAAIVEFGWREFADKETLARAPFYLVAYLSYRLGYCTMAAESGPDAGKFRIMAHRYATRLRNEINRLR